MQATIIVETNGGNWWSVYLNNPSRETAEILLEKYNDQRAAESTVTLGNLSTLGFSMDKPEGHSWANPVPGYSVAYVRDRGERMGRNGPRGWSTLSEALDNARSIGYATYLWDYSTQAWYLIDWAGVPRKIVQDQVPNGW
jgi:hypothetical protein